VSQVLQFLFVQRHGAVLLSSVFFILPPAGENMHHNAALPAGSQTHQLLFSPGRRWGGVSGSGKIPQSAFPNKGCLTKIRCEEKELAKNQRNHRYLTINLQKCMLFMHRAAVIKQRREGL